MLEDRHLRAGACRNVRKLGGDKTAAHQGDALGQRFHRKETLVVHQVLFTRDVQLDRLGARRQQDVLSLENVIGYLQRVFAHESRFPVVGVDSLFPVSLLHLLRHRVCECALERHQFLPVDCAMLSINNLRPPLAAA